MRKKSVVVLAGCACFFLTLALFVLPEASSKGANRLGRDGYTLIRTRLEDRGDGSLAQVSGLVVRYVGSNGAFKQVSTYFRPDGSVDASSTLVGDPQMGVFLVNDKLKKIRFLSGFGESPPAGVAPPQARSPHYDRSDEILGMVADVQRQALPDGGYDEYWTTPGLDVPVKMVHQRADGSRSILEATQILWASDPEQLHFDVADYQLDESVVRKKIEAMTAAGDLAGARLLRQDLADFVSKQRVSRDAQPR